MDRDDWELQQQDIDLLKSMAIQDWKRQFEAWQEETPVYTIGSWDRDEEFLQKGGRSGTYWGQ